MIDDRFGPDEEEATADDTSTDGGDNQDVSDEIADALREVLSGGDGKPAIMIITPPGHDAPRSLHNLTPLPSDLNLDEIFGDHSDDKGDE